MSRGRGLAADPPRYHLRLFVAGTSPLSLRTIQVLRRLCGRYLAGRVDLEVVDIYQQPELAERDQILAAPTLVKLAPLPLRRLIGDLSDERQVLRALALPLEDTDGE
ncbi:MAG: KaiB domain protein [Roseomonas sp.]|jgi:circadian clock protein KaiB|nr:KaiB domain protein [Roseomonas sp.]